MQTYLVQYRQNGEWRNYTADDGTPVEFIFLNHAQSVARDLSAFVDNLPNNATDWRIRDSQGNTLSVPVKNVPSWLLEAHQS